MPECIVLCGLPAAGKSTFRASFESPKYEILSTDDFIEDHARQVGLTYNEVFKDYMPIAEDRFWAALGDAVKNNRNFVVDRTNLTIKSRRRVLSKVVKTYTKFAVVFMIPQNKTEKIEHNRRLANRPGKIIPQHVIAMMEKQFEMPTTDEGFNSVLQFDFWGNSIFK